MLHNFVACYPIKSHHIQRCDTRRTVLIGNALVQLTPTEYQILIPLLNGVAVEETDLLHILSPYTTSEQQVKCLKKHIERMREKFKPVGLYIYAILGYGYILLEARV